jgi:hypothetical protein
MEIKSCKFTTNTACVDVAYENDSVLSLYVPVIENSLMVTVYSKPKMDWLIENNPLEYVQMVLDGTMQRYLDRADYDTRNHIRWYTARLTEFLPPDEVAEIVREAMLYN